MLGTMAGLHNGYDEGSDLVKGGRGDGRLE
jgi:hypothetical protein